MDNQEVKELLSVLKAAYPMFYKGIGRKEAFGIVNLWQMMFADDAASEVAMAVKSLIATRVSNFPPNIGEVKDELEKMRHPRERTALEAWTIVSKAVTSCDLQHPRKTFDELPVDIQMAVGSPDILLSWAKSEEDTFQTVIASNFRRSYTTAQNRDRAFAKMPTDVRRVIESKTDIDMLPPTYTPLTEGEFNSKRNEAMLKLIKI